jgi:hypothetical protein
VDIQGSRTGCDFLDLGDGVDLSSSLGAGGVYLLTVVSIFCRLGNAVKDYVLISLPCTKGSVDWAK